MTIISLERRIQKIEAQRFREDPALKPMSNNVLAQVLREVSDDPAGHAFADWFQAGSEGLLPAGALDTFHRSF